MSQRLKAAQYEPTTPEEHIRGVSVLLPVQERAGFVFALGYVKKESADAEAFLQLLSDQLHRLAESFGREANPQHRFEQFLGALNETLAAHVREGRWIVPIEHVHALVGLATAKQMYLSGTGELTALFLHRTPSQRYQVFNLFRGIQTEQSLPTWEKPFAVVLDGDLHPDDVLCVCDKDVQRAIDPEELNLTLTTLPPTSAVEKIRQCFPHKDGLLLIVLKLADTDEPSAHGVRSAIPTAGVSIGALGETVDATTRLLEDQRPKLSSIIAFVKRWVKARLESKSRLLQDLNAKDTTLNALKRLGRTLMRIALIVGKRSVRHVRAGLLTLRNPQERQKLLQRVEVSGASAQDHVRHLLMRAKRVPRSTQFLALGIAVAIVALVTGISVMSKSQARAHAQRLYQEQVLTIEDLMERGAGAVIYQDETQARSLYLNAQTLIEALPADTPERATKAAELAADIQVAMNEIRHLVTIPNPPLLADLSLLVKGVTGTSILSRAGTITLTGSDGRLYTYDRGAKRFAVAISPEIPLPLMSSSQEDGRAYGLGQDGNVYALLIDEERVQSAGIGDARWVDVEAYANRLYLLRPTVEGAQGQVVRYDRTGSSFTKEHNWITSRTVSLDEAVSLAVDGNVHILMRDGDIARFDTGSEVGWKTGLVEPQITAATKLWTDADSKFLYVLEPATNRLVIFQKDTGAFLVQYRSDAFAGLTDFLVDEKGYTIYLLAGSKLYSIAASHIE